MTNLIPPQFPNNDQWPTQICPECMGEAAGIINFCERVKQTQLTIEARYGQSKKSVPVQTETLDNNVLLVAENGEMIYEIQYIEKDDNKTDENSGDDELGDLIVNIQQKATNPRKRPSTKKDSTGESKTMVAKKAKQPSPSPIDVDAEPSPRKSSTREKSPRKSDSKSTQNNADTDDREKSPSTNGFGIMNKLILESGVLICKICPKEQKFADYISMKDHNKKEHMVVGVKCCGTPFRSATRLAEHIALHEPNDEELNCKICDKTFSSMSKLKQHSKNHKGDTIKCPTCDFTCKTEKSLARHELTHTPAKDRSVECDKCDFKCNFPSQLKTHVQAKHSDTKPTFNCGDCDKSFSTKQNLQNHEKSFHTLDAQWESCPKCGKEVRRLGKHLQICQNKQELKCEQCGSIHPNTHALATHITRMHVKTQKLTCHLCGKTLSRESNLRVSSEYNWNVTETRM